jgi:hypothetical protein
VSEKKRRETIRRRVLHSVGWKLVRLTHWLDSTWSKLNPFQEWNLRLHDWMECNRLCCSRHGYTADPQYCDPEKQEVAQ